MEHPRRFEVEPPRRVLIVGNRGAGKRSLARLLAERFRLSSYWIDRDPSLRSLSEEARKEIADWTRSTDWVITTGDAEGLDLAVSRAEWLVWIDLPISTCLIRVIRQRLRFRRAVKAGKAPPKAPTTRLRDVLSYPTELAPHVMHVIDRERRARTIYILRSRSEVATFVRRLPGAGRIDDHLRPGQPGG
jgi:adenylate kinase family enzyme